MRKDKYADLHAQLYPHAAAKPEYVICAAVWFKDGKKYKNQPLNVEDGYVVCGRRHHNCFPLDQSLLEGYSEKEGNLVTGFLTSKDVFLDRKEAGKLAFEAGQTNEFIECLFSEDLY